MYLFASALAVAILVFTAGCATKSDGHASPTPVSQTDANANRIASPVAIPGASARKVVMSMTGSKQVTEAKDWPDFKREWRDTFAEHAKEAGIAFSFIENAAQPAAEPGTLIVVDVADYRMIGIGARIMFGLMTGNAYIDAKLRYANLQDGKAFGEQHYNISSSAGSGVFAKVTPQQVDAIGAQVFRDLKAAK